MTIKNKANRIPPVGADTTVNTNTTPAEDRIDCSIIPLTNRNKSRYNDGLDWVRQPSNDLPSGAVSLSVNVGIPNSDGSWRTVTSDELRRQTKESRLYDGRYEGQENGDPLDRSIHSSSGLRMGKPRSDDNDGSSNGLNV